MPRRQAMNSLHGTVYGAAKMVLETGKHRVNLRIWCAHQRELLLRLFVLEANN